MRIKAETLKNFVRKASLNGAIKTMNFNFLEDGLHSKIRDISNTALTETFLSRDAFSDYKPIGELYIKDTLALLKYLSSFQDEIELSNVEEYALSFKDDSREIIVLTGAKIVCDNIFEDEFPTISVNSKFTIDKESLKSTYKDLSFVEYASVEINRDEDSVTFVIGNSNETDEFRNTVSVEHSDVKARVVIGSLFKNLYECVDDTINVFLETDKPIRVEEETDILKFKCLIAPIIRN